MGCNVICGVKQPECSCPDCTKLGDLSCTFALSGRRLGETCGARLCLEHAGDKKVPPLCRAHAKLLAGVYSRGGAPR